MSLRTKMKNIRMPLKLESVKILKEKFGCPGTGGRKRMAETVYEEKEACRKRQKLKVHSFFFFLVCLFINYLFEPGNAGSPLLLAKTLAHCLFHLLIFIHGNDTSYNSFVNFLMHLILLLLLSRLMLNCLRMMKRQHSDT